MMFALLLKEQLLVITVLSILFSKVVLRLKLNLAFINCADELCILYSMLLSLSVVNTCTTYWWS